MCQSGMMHSFKHIAGIVSFHTKLSVLMLSLMFVLAAEADALKIEDGVIAGPEPSQNRQAWLGELQAYRKNIRQGDFSLYDRRDLEWLASNFTCHFTFMYDRCFFDPERSVFTPERFLEEGRREFGGYDSILLWHAYPRIGVDERNQFDFYRDMPGGLDGLRNVVERIHQYGVKVFINYNPWDAITRREPGTIDDALAEMVAAIDADGIFLDTMTTAQEKLRDIIDAKRKGTVLVPELYPDADDLVSLMGSWYQIWNDTPFSPGLLHHKWIEQRHMQYQIRRWNGVAPGTSGHYQEIENAFFNGSGMLIWENIFGSYNPWNAQDRAMWSRAVRILRAFSGHFISGNWQPFVPTAHKDLYAHGWSLGSSTIYTLVNKGRTFDNEPIISVPSPDNSVECFDLWEGKKLTPVTDENGNLHVIGFMDKLGCVLVTADAGNPRLTELLENQQKDNWRKVPGDDLRNISGDVTHPEPMARTEPIVDGRKPEGMVFVPGAMLTMKIEHVRRECGCYPDPSATPEKQRHYFLMGQDFSGIIKHEIGPVQVHPFFIDETEVTNAQYLKFMEHSGYKPKHPENFLKHWPGGKMPEELADHPVVYVDIDDAMAFAHWAGKQLPTEQQWHLAAQGTDGRKWPWGNEFNPKNVNTTGTQTMSVKSCPNGRSPYGCYHMSGNVYEWTESYRDDRHTRFVIIRGGSYFNNPWASPPQKGCVWDMEGGPRPCDHHAKFILMWPGLDRCSTIGFRCVRDVQNLAIGVH